MRSAPPRHCRTHGKGLLSEQFPHQCLCQWWGAPLADHPTAARRRQGGSIALWTAPFLTQPSVRVHKVHAVRLSRQGGKRPALRSHTQLGRDAAPLLSRLRCDASHGPCSIARQASSAMPPRRAQRSVPTRLLPIHAHRSGVPSLSQKRRNSPYISHSDSSSEIAESCRT